MGVEKVEAKAMTIELTEPEVATVLLALARLQGSVCVQEGEGIVSVSKVRLAEKIKAQVGLAVSKAESL